MTGSPEVAACRLAAPAYVSGLSALAWHGVSPLLLRPVQCASLRPAGRLRAEGVEVEIIEVPDDLFDGFEVVEDPFGGGCFPLASPERALVDYLMGCERAGTRPELSALDLDLLDAAAVWRAARRAGVDLAAHLPAGPGLHDEPLRSFAERLARAASDDRRAG